MSHTRNKFLEEPKHALDIHSQRRVVKKLNALLNSQITDEKGNVIGTVEIADGNTVFKLKASSGGSAVAAFAITELGHEDFFIARKLSGFRQVAGISTADVGATDFKIAKTRITRRSIVADQPDSVPITYADTGSDHDNNRIANDGTDDESQCVYPRYQTLAELGFASTVPMTENCVICAEQVGSICGVFGDDGKALEWLEAPGRVWAKRFAP